MLTAVQLCSHVSPLHHLSSVQHREVCHASCADILVLANILQQVDIMKMVLAAEVHGRLKKEKIAYYYINIGVELIHLFPPLIYPWCLLQTF